MSWLVALLAGFQVTIIGRIWVTPEDRREFYSDTLAKLMTGGGQKLTIPHSKKDDDSAFVGIRTRDYVLYAYGSEP